MFAYMQHYYEHFEMHQFMKRVVYIALLNPYILCCIKSLQKNQESNVTQKNSAYGQHLALSYVCDIPKKTINAVKNCQKGQKHSKTVKMVNNGQYGEKQSKTVKNSQTQ